MEQSLVTLLESILKDRDLFLRRGLDLARSKQQSDEINEIASALAKAQGEFTPIIKETPGYGYKYAPLDDILEMVIPILSSNGIAFIQYMTEDAVLHTRIMHTSGQWLESQFPIPLPTEKEFFENSGKKISFMQEIGSRRTYARKYEAMSLLGISPKGEDEDGTGYNIRQNNTGAIPKSY